MVGGVVLKNVLPVGPEVCIGWLVSGSFVLLTAGPAFAPISCEMIEAGDDGIDDGADDGLLVWLFIAACRCWAKANIFVIPSWG